MKKLLFLVFFGIALTANFAQVIAVGEDDLTLSQNIGSITICKIIADSNGDVITGGDAAATFYVPASPAPVILTSFDTPIDLNADILYQDGINDAECVRYGNLPIARYYYNEETIVEGNNWEPPFYNDQFTIPVQSLNDFFLFNITDGNADGIIQLGPIRPNRTLVVLNRYSSPPIEAACNDGIDNDNDGEIDFPADTGCENADDNDENARPEITLLGNNPEIVTLGTEFVDPGATALDFEDGNLTSEIVITGSVATSTVGTYLLNHSVIDSGGLTDEENRNVLVKTACTDGRDNDGDGLIDMEDDGCADEDDNDESLPPINLPPYFIGPAYASTTLGNSFDLVVKAEDPNNDLLSVTSTIPEGATYNVETGRFLWTPGVIGTSTAYFSASDGATSTDFSVLLEVFENATTTVNLSPYFVDFNPSTNATATLLYSYDVNAFDPEDDTLVFSLEIAPQGMTIAFSTGFIQWMPTQEQATGTPYAVQIGLSDGLHSTSTSYAITVNQAPASTSTTPTLTIVKHVINDGIGEKTSSDFLIRVSNNSLEIASFYGSETGVTIPLTVGSYSVFEDPELIYFGTFGADCSGEIAFGEHKICTVTNDDRLVPHLDRTTLIVKKHVINDNGGTKVASDFTINVSSTVVSSSSFPGSEEGTIIYLAPGVYSVDEVAVDGYVKTIGENCSGTIALGEIKTCTITNDDNAPPIDDGGNNNSPTHVIVVGGGGGGSMNYPPRFRNFNPPLFAAATELYSYDVDSYDLENDPITHSLNLAPSGIIIASSTGLISWVPTLSQISPIPYLVRIALSDGGRSSSQTIESYSVTVVAPVGYVPPIAPIIPSVLGPETNPPPRGGNVLGFIEGEEVPATTTEESASEETGRRSLLAALIGALGNFFGSLNPFCVIVSLILLVFVVYLMWRNRRLAKRLNALKSSRVKDISEIPEDTPPINLESEELGEVFLMGEESR